VLRAPTQRTTCTPKLEQNFNVSIEQAAKNLGIGLSTLQSICRHHGILRWPGNKMKMNAVEGSRPRKLNSRQVKVSTRSAVATIKKEVEDISIWVKPIKKEPK
jgi:hypothetical protein